MKKSNGFLELTAATVFGLVMLAASAVGVFLGQIALSRKTPPPSKAGNDCISLEVYKTDEQGNRLSEAAFSQYLSEYKASYTFSATVRNISGEDTQVSLFAQENSPYITNTSGGVGVQTLTSGDSRTATITIYMNTSGDNNWLNKAGTTTQAKIYGTSRNVGDWGCYADEVQIITFGTAGPTATPTPTPIGCQTNADCYDSNPCTNDICGTDRQCYNPTISGTHKECENNTCVDKPNTGIACTNTCSTNADCTTTPTSTPPTPTGKPDLEAISLRPVSTTIKVGDAVHFRFSYRNKGAVPVSISYAWQLDVDGVVLMGASGKKPVEVNQPPVEVTTDGYWVAQAGNHHATVFVDSGNKIDEMREDNNKAYATIGIPISTPTPTPTATGTPRPTATPTPTPTATPCPKPAAPLNFVVSQICNPDGQAGKVKIGYAWQDNSTNENGFRLYYSPGIEGVDVQINGDRPAISGSGVWTSYSETIPVSTCQQRKMYSVASFNECGESGRGTATAPATNCCPTPTATPTLTPIPTPHSFQLDVYNPSQWQQGSDNWVCWAATDKDGKQNVSGGPNQSLNTFICSGSASANSLTVGYLNREGTNQNLRWQTNRCAQTRYVNNVPVCETYLASGEVRDVAPHSTLTCIWDNPSTNSTPYCTTTTSGTISGTVRVIANNNSYDEVAVWKCDLSDPTDPSSIKGVCNSYNNVYAGADRTDNAEFNYKIGGLTDGKEYIVYALVAKDGTILKNSDHDIDCPTAPGSGHCVVTVPAFQNFTITIPAGGGGVSASDTDLNNDGGTNSLDWTILVTDWIAGKYNALDASSFLHTWAAQAGS